jgi:tRNA threonylcarbamoyladenosine biosynthesis protein TsaE
MPEGFTTNIMISSNKLRQALNGKVAMNLLSNSVDETHQLARELAEHARPGEVIALFGDLGSGKTTLVQGFCKAGGVTAPITSPTFTLMHIYRGAPWPIYHFDFYRLRSVAEAQALGCEEYFDGDGVSLIEWPERALALLPARHLQIHLRIPDFNASPQLREIKIHRAEGVA